MKTHHKKSKRQKLSTKYNLQKKVREHKRRLKKQAKKMNLGKKVRKDPGIPNSWPFKAEMLQDLEEQKEKRDEDMAKRREKAKELAKLDHKQLEKDRREAQQARETARREKREKEVEQAQLGTLRKTLPEAKVLLQVLDSRDPLGCRCAALEAWAAANQKRLIFVLAKADLMTPEAAAKWILFLGQIAPTVAVQAEAGREGVRELLALLGEAPGSGALPKATAPAVGVVGYAGTGKRALCKAMRQELKSTAPWLLESCRLPPHASQAPTTTSALHEALCKNTARGAASATSIAATLASGGGAGAAFGVEPVDVIKEFLTRTTQQAVLRHFRLPAFEGAEGFLKVFCEDRKLKNKKGKVLQPSAIAQRILAELPALPGCFCTAPAESQGAQNFWSLHGDVVQQIKQVMEAQCAALSARGVSGPAATALVIASSPGLGPSVDIEGLLRPAVETDDFIEGEDEVSDSDEEELSDEDMGEEGEEDLEGEEEEELEGEESEEDDMSDDV